ncbi:hypothetical protein U0070_011943 [Myodes glareolus]|uniref:Uncharacterized protein n=1 Tax=Myodes glareolus TaxID=447135 RepID=A0AAW0HNS0_MYOGA
MQLKAQLGFPVTLSSFQHTGKCASAPENINPETLARCLTKSSSASSPASLLLCAHSQSALSLALPQSVQSLVLPKSALSLVLLHSAQSHATLSHASRNALLCNLLHPASRSAHPRATECFSSHQDQEKRRKSVSHTSTEPFHLTSKPVVDAEGSCPPFALLVSVMTRHTEGIPPWLLSL